MSLSALGLVSGTARERVGSRADQWDRIVSAAVAEFKNSLIAGKILPSYGTAPEALTVPQDKVNYPPPPAVPGTSQAVGALQVLTPYQVVPLQEIWVELILSEQHLSEPDLATANTMLQRAARLLAQAEDLIVFQGSAVYKPTPIPPFGLVVKVRYPDLPVDPSTDGLLKAAGFPASPVVPPAPPVVPPPVGHRKWCDETFTAVVTAQTQLIAAGNNQPFALALPPAIYADTFAPTNRGSSEIPADRIKPLVTDGFYATSALPQNMGAPVGSAAGSGVLISAGGGTMDLVVGKEPTVTFTQEDGEGLARFRMYTRFALRVRVNQAIARLDFIVS